MSKINTGDVEIIPVRGTVFFQSPKQDNLGVSVDFGNGVVISRSYYGSREDFDKAVSDQMIKLGWYTK